MIDWKARCAELIDELHCYKNAHPQHDTDLIDRIRADLAQFETEGLTEVTHEQLLRLKEVFGDPDSITRPWQVCMSLNRQYSSIQIVCSDLDQQDFDYLAQPGFLQKPRRPASALMPIAERLPGPKDCDSEGLLHLAENGLNALRNQVISSQDDYDAIFVALNRLGRPAIKPVPVAERPWEREGWCDDNGWCWGFDADDTDPCWVFDKPESWSCWTHSLPHNALPLPTLLEMNPCTITLSDEFSEKISDALSDFYDEWPLPDWAIDRTDKYCVGAQLPTRDGRRVGNAVITNNHFPNPSPWEVVTDAGGAMRLDEVELNELYWPPRFIMAVNTSPGVRARANRDPRF